MATLNKQKSLKKLACLALSFLLMFNSVSWATNGIASSDVHTLRAQSRLFNLLTARGIDLSKPAQAKIAAAAEYALQGVPLVRILKDLALWRLQPETAPIAETLQTVEIIGAEKLDDMTSKVTFRIDNGPITTVVYHDTEGFIALEDGASGVHSRIGRYRKPQDESISPTLEDEIPEHYLDTVFEHLRITYPAQMEALISRVNHYYFADYMPSAAGIYRLGENTFYLIEEKTRELLEGLPDNLDKARKVILYLLAVHESTELILRNEDDTITPDINTEIAAFLYKAQAYLKLTRNNTPLKDSLLRAAALMDEREENTNDIDKRFLNVFNMIETLKDEIPGKLKDIKKDTLQKIEAWIKQDPDYKNASMRIGTIRGHIRLITAANRKMRKNIAPSARFQFEMTSVPLDDGQVGVDVDSFGNAYLGDRQNNTLIVVDSSGKKREPPINLSSIIPDHEHPKNIAVDSSGNPFILFDFSTEIAAIDLKAKRLNVNIGNRGIISLRDIIYDKIVDDYEKIVAPSGSTENFNAALGYNDILHEDIRKLFDSDRQFMSHDLFFELSRIAINDKGNIFVADEHSNVIFVLDPSGKHLDTNFGINGIITSKIGNLDCPRDIEISKNGNILVSNFNTNTISVLNSDGKSLNHMVGKGGIISPDKDRAFASFYIATDSENNIFISNLNAPRTITVFHPDGRTPNTSFGPGGVITLNIGEDESIHDIAIGPENDIHVLIILPEARLITLKKKALLEQNELSEQAKQQRGEHYIAELKKLFPFEEHTVGSDIQYWHDISYKNPGGDYDDYTRLKIEEDGAFAIACIRYKTRFPNPARIKHVRKLSYNPAENKLSLTTYDRGGEKHEYELPDGDIKIARNISGDIIFIVNDEVYDDIVDKLSGLEWVDGAGFISQANIIKASDTDALKNSQMLLNPSTLAIADKEIAKLMEFFGCDEFEKSIIVNRGEDNTGFIKHVMYIAFTPESFKLKYYEKDDWSHTHKEYVIEYRPSKNTITVKNIVFTAEDEISFNVYDFSIKARRAENGEVFFSIPPAIYEAIETITEIEGQQILGSELIDKFRLEKGSLSNGTHSRLGRYRIPQDKSISPTLEDEIPEHYLDEAFKRLKATYPAQLEALINRVTHYYFADYMPSAAGIYQLGDNTFYLIEEKTRQLLEGLPDELAEAREALKYLLMVHEGTELLVREGNDTITPDINSEVIAFFHKAQAYYRLTKDNEDLKSAIHKAAELMDRDDVDTDDVDKRFKNVLEMVDTIPGEILENLEKVDEDTLERVVEWIKEDPDYKDAVIDKAGLRSIMQDVIKTNNKIIVKKKEKKRKEKKARKRKKKKAGKKRTEEEAEERQQQRTWEDEIAEMKRTVSQGKYGSEHDCDMRAIHSSLAMDQLAKVGANDPEVQDLLEEMAREGVNEDVKRKAREALEKLQLYKNDPSRFHSRLGRYKTPQDESISPTLEDEIPEHYLDEAFKRLKSTYQAQAEALNTRIDHYFFADYMPSAAGIYRLGAYTFYFIEEKTRQLLESLPDELSEAREAIKYLLLVHEGTELLVREGNDTITPDINSEIIAFLHKAQAYYLLTRNNAELKTALHKAAELMDREDEDVADVDKRFKNVFEMIDMIPGEMLKDLINLDDETLERIVDWIKEDPDYHGTNAEILNIKKIISEIDKKISVPAEDVRHDASTGKFIEQLKKHIPFVENAGPMIQEYILKKLSGPEFLFRSIISYGTDTTGEAVSIILINLLSSHGNLFIILSYYPDINKMVFKVSTDIQGQNIILEKEISGGELIIGVDDEGKPFIALNDLAYDQIEDEGLNMMHSGKFGGSIYSGLGGGTFDGSFFGATDIIRESELTEEQQERIIASSTQKEIDGTHEKIAGLMKFLECTEFKKVNVYYNNADGYKFRYVQFSPETLVISYVDYGLGASDAEEYNFEYRPFEGKISVESNANGLQKEIEFDAKDFSINAGRRPDGEVIFNISQNVYKAIKETVTPDFNGPTIIERLHLEDASLPGSAHSRFGRYRTPQDKSITPTLEDEIPEHYLDDAFERLQSDYPAQLEALIKKVTHYYFADYMPSAAGVYQLGDNIFYLIEEKTRQLLEALPDKFAEARKALKYLLMVHEATELLIRGDNDTITPDIKSEIIAFLYKSQAYHLLTKHNPELKTAIHKAAELMDRDDVDIDDIDKRFKNVLDMVDTIPEAVLEDLRNADKKTLIRIRDWIKQDPDYKDAGVKAKTIQKAITELHARNIKAQKRIKRMRRRRKHELKQRKKDSIGNLDTQIIPQNIGEFDWPRDIAFDKKGNIFVANENNDTVSILNPDGKSLNKKYGDKGIISPNTGDLNPLLLYNPVAVAFDNEENILILCNEFDNMANRHRQSIVALNPDGKSLNRSFGQGGVITNDIVDFGLPYGLAIDSDGNIFVTDARHNRINVLYPDGKGLNPHFGEDGIIRGLDISGPYGITLDQDRNIFVTNNGPDQVIVLKPDGKSRNEKFGEDGIIAQDVGQFRWPFGVAIDNDRNIIVTHFDLTFGDDQSYLISVLNPDGKSLNANYGEGGLIKADKGLERVCGVAVSPTGSIGIAGFRSESIIMMHPQPESNNIGIQWFRKLVDEIKPVKKESELIEELLEVLLKVLKTAEKDTKIIIGFETEWIPLEQQAIVQPLINAIKSIAGARGFDDLIVIHGKGDNLADRLLSTCESTGTPLKQVLVLAGKDTIASEKFNQLRGPDASQGALMAGVNPEKLKIADVKHLQKVKDTLIIEMLIIALNLALDEKYPVDHKFIKVKPVEVQGKKVSRSFEFIPDIPDAEALDFKALRKKYQLQYQAIEQFV